MSLIRKSTLRVRPSSGLFSLVFARLNALAFARVAPLGWLLRVAGVIALGLGLGMALGIALPLMAAPAWASDDGDSEGGQAEESQAPTLTGELFVAGSVCEAHELRALAAEKPSMILEIPPEFAGQWPSRSACESARLAWDPEAPGPIQPIPFSHKHHAGEFGIDCQYCHSGTDRSPAAGVPSVELCMGCHAQFPASYDEIEGIRILKEHWEERKPIEWIQIHRLPEHVQFLDEPQAASPSAPVAEPARPTDGLPEVTLAEAENVLIRDVLTRTGGNIAAAARLLGTNRPRIYRFLEQESGRKPD